LNFISIVIKCDIASVFFDCAPIVSVAVGKSRKVEVAASAVITLTGLPSFTKDIEPLAFSIFQALNSIPIGDSAVGTVKLPLNVRVAVARIIRSRSTGVDSIDFLSRFVPISLSIHIKLTILCIFVIKATALWPSWIAGITGTALSPII
jgi:hypothetical protein